jgi:hypothetical protein
MKRMVCLANSRKLQGRCIAGRELINEQPVGWLRPVSAREREEVSEYERQYQDGSDPRILDIIDVPLLEPRPSKYQTENWLLDPDRYWVKGGRMSVDEIARLCEPAAPLWTNGHSSYNGRNDRIPVAEADRLDSSLRLVRVDKLRLAVFKPGEAFGNPKRRVQAQFEHNGMDYHLWVTDPDFERTYLAKADGTYDIGESFLTISLGEPQNNYCYKLVAAIIPKQAGGAA